MIEFDGDHMRVSGPLTLVTAREAALTVICPTCKVSVVDLGGVTAVDSSALGVLMQWSRQARELSLNLTFINIPASLRSLADLYDVAGMLSISDPANLTTR